ncbi:MAG: NERD domain-containing protein [Thermodesulfobacteriota bacterium]
MTTLPVDTLTFEFPDDWPVIKYDDCHFYRNGQRKPEGTKAVDVLAIAPHGLFIIEAKDFRGTGIENKQELVQALSRKIRDTLAMLYGAHTHGDRALERFCNYLFSGASGEIKVIFVLEEDRPSSKKQSAFRAVRSSLRSAIKKPLRFIKADCNLHTCDDVPRIYGWTVR